MNAFDAPMPPTDGWPGQLLEASRDLIFILDRESRFVWANSAFLHAAGRHLEEVRGQVALPPTPDGSRHFLEDDAQVFATGRALEIAEEAVLFRDGSTRWLNTVKSPIVGKNGEIALLLAISRDVTEARATRIALDRINECLIGLTSDPTENIGRLTTLCGELLGADAAVYNRLDKGVLSAVGQWNVGADFNPIADARDTPCAELISRGGDELLVTPGPDGYAAYVGRVVKNGERAFGALCALFRHEPAPDTVFAKVLGILASAVAVEEERLRRSKEHARLSEELRQAQKMEAVGRLAGGIAHDFNNTLTAIKGYAEMLRAAARDPGMKSDAGEILKSVDYAASLTRQLLAFGRRQVLVPRVIDLNETARASARMLRRLIGENIRLQEELTPSPTPVYADPGQMEQVLINLALNARDAMPDGGTLTLRTAEASPGEVPLSPGGRPAAGRYVVVSVADTGAGISPEIRPHIFEPFFTTKEKGKGTGLGLSTVYGIVAQSGGRVTCDSVPGSGSMFQVWMPRSDAALEPTSTAPPSSAADLRGNGALLLVEDDPAIRGMFARVLEAAGYDVLAAGNAEEALRLAAGPESRIDALVTDVMMPGLNGRQLAMRLEKTRPNLKVIYMSGYTDDAAFRGALRPGTAFLQKPFNPVELCRKLKEILA